MKLITSKLFKKSLLSGRTKFIKNGFLIISSLQIEKDSVRFFYKGKELVKFQLDKEIKFSEGEVLNIVFYDGKLRVELLD